MLSEGRDFHQQEVDELLLDDLAHLTGLAIREDLDRKYDLTTVAVVPAGLQAEASIVSRKSGVAAGVALLPAILENLESNIELDLRVEDGLTLECGTTLAVLSGDARDILTCERIVLNFLGRLCGIASWTSEHVRLIQDLDASLYDTRKTTPGWRRLEKYATRCGGAKNHRSGLHEAIMVKDNHLACHATVTGDLMQPSEAVQHCRQFLETSSIAADTIVEIEVDSIEQLRNVLRSDPDIVLLDNMDCDQLREAVGLRNSMNPDVQLEASGGITLKTLRERAETGVERISLGALTHSARNLDLGLDWQLHDPKQNDSQ